MSYKATVDVVEFVGGRDISLSLSHEADTEEQAIRFINRALALFTAGQVQIMEDDDDTPDRY